MRIAKHKKLIVSVAAVAALALGGGSALAMSAAPTLTPVPNVDVSKIEAVPGTYMVVEGPAVAIEGAESATTAPRASLAPAGGDIGVDPSKAKQGDVTVAEGVTPQLAGGNYTTAAG
jgi:hypothetical protein